MKTRGGIMKRIVVTNPVSRARFAELAAEEFEVSPHTAYTYIKVSRRNKKGQFLRGKMYSVARRGVEMIGYEKGLPEHEND